MKSENYKKILALLFVLLSIFMSTLINQAFAYEKASGESYAVMEVSSGRLLYAFKEDQKKPMASTTKIMTAIVILEECDLDDIVTVGKESAGVEGSSIYLRSGEKLTVKELLYGLMLRSGNDCAEALARFCAGSIQKFADKMNEKAKEIGAINSHFVNPHGLHDDDHYTTARDLALITVYAMKNPMFREIVGCKKTVISGNDEVEKRVLINKNKMLYNYSDCTGIKTGYTKKAGRCLVSGAKRMGMDVVCVVLNCAPMYERSTELLNSAFNEYKMTKIFCACDEIEMLPVKNLKDFSCPVGVKSDVYLPLKKGEKEKLKFEIQNTNEISAPFEMGKEAGDLKVYCENQLLFSGKIYTIIGIDKKQYSDIIRDIKEDWIL